MVTQVGPVPVCTACRHRRSHRHSVGTERKSVQRIRRVGRYIKILAGRGRTPCPSVRRRSASFPPALGTPFVPTDKVVTLVGRLVSDVEMRFQPGSPGFRSARSHVIPLGKAPRLNPVDATLPGVDGDSRAAASAPPVVGILDEPQQVRRSRRILFDHEHLGQPVDTCSRMSGWHQQTAGRNAHRIPAHVHGETGVPSVLSELMGKTVIPPGPGFAGVYSSEPLALFW